ncbi:hypothetical protein EV06_1075 [Prochlorococcus sp. MIT 0602]|nr:hypothetical protein EV06_1075 [Prochlorococcus sp. MIT 0602]KGG17481.1 hypothetical protein EV07_0921 [Prochlorococcus sp. MIT 0603]
MSYKVCKRCGSSDLIADRALAGRLICSVCGSSSLKNSYNFINKSLLPKSYGKFIFYLLLAFFIIFIIF